MNTTISLATCGQPPWTTTEEARPGGLLEPRLGSAFSSGGVVLQRSRVTLVGHDGDALGQDFEHQRVLDEVGSAHGSTRELGVHVTEMRQNIVLASLWHPE